MTTILLIGLSLFLCSAAAIFVTMRGASISDLRRKPVRGYKIFSAKKKAQIEGTQADQAPLADRRRLDDHARSLEGATFFF